MSATPRSRCPIANTLDLIGDRWTLLLVRDLLFTEKRRYGELSQSPERIPTNILADRLKRLEQAGIVERTAYQSHPPRYQYALTAKGKELADVIVAIIRWGSKHVEHAADLDDAHIDALLARVK